VGGGGVSVWVGGWLGKVGGIGRDGGWNRGGWEGEAHIFVIPAFYTALLLHLRSCILRLRRRGGRGGWSWVRGLGVGVPSAVGEEGGWGSLQKETG